MSASETIVAPCTAIGRGSVAIVRISGNNVKPIATKIIGKIPEPRYAMHCSFLDEQSKPLDVGVALFFPAPNSFTGEDVLELHTHGSPIVVDRLIQQIVFLGARVARPGEFSERAFLNNKMDLLQAEAIADLIDAGSREAADAALRSLQGEFSKKITQLVESLIHLRMYVEAAIDFVEEEVDFLNDTEIIHQLNAILLTLESIQKTAKEGAQLREGIHLVIFGEPNVGKSSLLNCLSCKESAIVTNVAGTTRDVLREAILIDGIPVHIVDTAGLRLTQDLVEQEGIKRTHAEIARADILLQVMDIHTQNVPNLTDVQGIPRIIIRNKIDLEESNPSVTMDEGFPVIALSAKTGLGIDLLKTEIKKILGIRTHQEGTFSARRRHLEALLRAQTFLQNGKEQLVMHKAGDLLADDLRSAQRALNEITGEFTTDDLLGRIFASFCIGK